MCLSKSQPKKEVKMRFCISSQFERQRGMKYRVGHCQTISSLTCCHRCSGMRNATLPFYLCTLPVLIDSNNLQIFERWRQLTTKKLPVTHQLFQLELISKQNESRHQYRGKNGRRKRIRWDFRSFDQLLTFSSFQRTESGIFPLSSLRIAMVYFFHSASEVTWLIHE